MNGGGQIDPPPEKASFKKPSLVRVNENFVAPFPCIHSAFNFFFKEGKCCTKNYVINKKNISHENYVAFLNFVSHKKTMLSRRKKICYTQKKVSCRLNMFSVAQKRNTC